MPIAGPAPHTARHTVCSYRHAPHRLHRYTGYRHRACHYSTAIQKAMWLYNAVYFTCETTSNHKVKTNPIYYRHTNAILPPYYRHSIYCHTIVPAPRFGDYIYTMSPTPLRAHSILNPRAHAHRPTTLPRHFPDTSQTLACGSEARQTLPRHLFPDTCARERGSADTSQTIPNCAINHYFALLAQRIQSSSVQRWGVALFAQDCEMYIRYITIPQ